MNSLKDVMLNENLPEMEDFLFRYADMNDINALVDIENRCFETDLISKRQFRYLLSKGHAAIIVVEKNGILQGDVVILFSRATSVARLYLLAVMPEMRGKKLGSFLIKASEKVTWTHHRAYMRLEVRQDNAIAVALYKSLGYRH